MPAAFGFGLGLGAVGSGFGLGRGPVGGGFGSGLVPGLRPPLVGWSWVWVCAWRVFRWSCAGFGPACKEPMKIRSFLDPKKADPFKPAFFGFGYVRI